MTVQEFSDQFDVLYNNITSNQAPGLNEYEKSVFLTKAQEELIKNYFNPKANLKQDGFDDSPKRQSDFSTLISTKILSTVAGTTTFDSDSRVYSLPSDLFISLNEQVTCSGHPYIIAPISYDEYDRLMAKPYKYPPKSQVWRIITNNYPRTISEIVPGSDTYVINDTDNPGCGDYEGSAISMTTSNTNNITLTVNILSTGGTASVNINSGTKTITLNIPADMKMTEFYNDYIVSNSNLWDYVDYIDLPDDSNFANQLDDQSSFCTLTAQATTSSTSSRVSIVEIRGRFSGPIVYRIRYVKQPSPIILVNLPDGLTIKGLSSIQQCQLPEELHEEILQRAVELAKVAWTANGQDNAQMVIQAGQRSE